MPRKKKDMRSPEESKAFALKQEVDKLPYLPEPAYFFDVGEEVEIGNLEDVIIVDIIADGKIYEIDYTRTDNNYGHPIVYTHQRLYVTWLEIRPISPPLSDRGLIQNEDLQLYFSQRDITGLLSMIYDAGMEMNPDYQRDLVWSDEDNKALIDSIFNNVDIGKFVIIYNEYAPDTPTYEVLDGKQRLHALASFYENRFPYRDLYFNDLNRKEKYQFTHFPVAVAQLRDITQQQKYRYFLNINRHGRVMTAGDLERVARMMDGENG